MSIIPLTPDNFETFTLELHPKREFSSGSAGITGSIHLFAERSGIQKNTHNIEDATFFDDNNNQTNLYDLVQAANGLGGVTKLTDFQGTLQNYLTLINAQTKEGRLLKTFDIKRHTPTETYAQIVTGSIRKQQIKNLLFPYYRSIYSSMQYAYTNYHTLNFFTASALPSDSVLLYANSASAPSTVGLASGTYMPEKGFSFEFYINPRYTTDEPRPFQEFHAGTLLHLSSTYAVSLVTGSSSDINGFPDGFRMMLQLSHSADIAPSIATQGVYPNDLIFLSSDNALRRNNWHHIAIRWGTSDTNEGTGSFVIDGVEKGRFNVPSSSIAPAAFQSSGNPDVLCVGNYFQGDNALNNKQKRFFTKLVSAREGLIKLSEETAEDLPAFFEFSHPLNAEVHDIKMYPTFRTVPQILSSALDGPETIKDLSFYIPPFFTKESPTRSLQSDGTGGVLFSPFAARTATTTDPFNVWLSFMVSGRDINLENFVREFKTGRYPRLLNLTSSVSPITSLKTANEVLYSVPSIKKRNLTILPCDNGRFRANYGLLKSGSLENFPKSGSLLDKYTNDFGVLNLSRVSIKDMLHSGAAGEVITSEEDFKIQGPTPTDMGKPFPGSGVNSLFQLTRNSDSNEIVVFDTSNTFYGNNIEENTFSIKDTDLSCSNGKITITLRDDGYGNLYRSDANTPHATWSSVGNVLYNEGAVLIKAPELSFFGKTQFSTEFKGSQPLHVLRVYAPAGAGLLNSSSNPSYAPISASLNPSDIYQKFVQITGVNFHDDNLNVIMRASFAQPILKRDIDSFIAKIRFDF